MADVYLKVLAHYFAKPGNGDALIAPRTELAAATRTQPSNLDFEFSRSPLDPDHFVIMEEYGDANGLAAHREPEHFQRLGLGIIIPLLERREVSSHMIPGDAA